MVVALCRSPLRADGTHRKPSVELAAELKRRWAALDDEAKGEILDHVYGTSWTPDSETARLEWTDITRDVHGLIDDLFGEGGGFRRDVAEIRPEEHWWLITGGPNGHDEDAYNPIVAMDVSGITVEPV